MAWIHARAAGDEASAAELRLVDGNILTPEGLRRGTLVCRDGLILGIEPGRGLAGRSGEDVGGDLLAPGFVELHTDNLERHIMPRPGIFWSDPLAALEAHDAQLAGAGITTVFDSVCVGEPLDKGRHAMLPLSLEAVNSGRRQLRCAHLLHLRCEISDPGMSGQLDLALGMARPDLVSIMDHTPGERQWRTPEDWLVYHQAKMPEDELLRVSRRLRAARDSCAEANIRRVALYARDEGIPLASHDDTDPGHVADAVRLGARISEFPTTLAAARAAKEAGLLTVLGTPNLVRGKSHSGNVKVSEVAEAGCLSCLSSDYVPGSLLHGAWKLWREHGFTLPEAMGAISANPARAAGLEDRGRIVPGLRADLVRVREIGGRPRLMGVWVGGERVF
ncbi:MAG: alpha-D-ribose 1-methylphosphonate 5-triphosphate diphosphatase [Deltaproteobacteria bacterium]|jgi:alpha-D-ribose 1-methylphosphonate 5-triphosphate diphosphatase|nr:alpha-D-ribose 1-methylphosphonate 5-triphosphate diphosphatase [Deltaproteobacteria bacterium]